MEDDIATVVVEEEARGVEGTYRYTPRDGGPDTWAADAAGAAADAAGGDDDGGTCLSWKENTCLFFRTIAQFLGFAYIVIILVKEIR